MTLMYISLRTIDIEMCVHLPVALTDDVTEVGLRRRARRGQIDP